MHYSISNTVVKQLQEIYSYNFYNYNKQRAEKILNSIDDMFEKATHNPNYYPRYLKNPNPNRNIRKAVIYKTYLLIFEVFEDYIQILSVYHGAMDK